eukprot:scaffold21193_cov45-Prasinocladus_malaysianus.AAC.1
MTGHTKATRSTETDLQNKVCEGGVGHDQYASALAFAPFTYGHRGPAGVGIHLDKKARSSGSDRLARP